MHSLRYFMVFVLIWTFSCRHRDESTKRNKVMTLESAAQRLAEISGEPLRKYSTYDFGRNRNVDARSVVVSKTRSHEILNKIRKEIGPNLVVFIGTTRWLGEEKHQGGEELVLAEADSQFDILRIAKSDAINYDMETEDLVKKLKEYNLKYGIDIFHAETDTIEFTLLKLPNDMNRFCKDLYHFCPDIVDQGVGTLEALEKEIRRNKVVYLWWD